MMRHVPIKALGFLALCLGACSAGSGGHAESPDAAVDAQAVQDAAHAESQDWDQSTLDATLDATTPECIDAIDATLDDIPFCDGTPSLFERVYTRDEAGEFIIAMTLSCETTQQTFGCVLTWPAGVPARNSSIGSPVAPPGAVFCTFADHRNGTSLAGGRNAGAPPQDLDDPLIAVVVGLTDANCLAATVDSWVGGADPSSSGHLLRRNLHLRMSGRVRAVE